MNVAQYVDQRNWPQSLQDAKTFALSALDSFKYKDQVPKLTKAVENATSVQRLQSIIINAILSGEGNKVLRI